MEHLLPFLLLVVAAAAALGLLILLLGLQRVFATAPRLAAAVAEQPAATGSLTVVIPAYNEAANIAACVSAVLASEPPCSDWSLLVVDDDSTDATADLAREPAAASPAFRAPRHRSRRPDRSR